MARYLLTSIPPRTELIPTPDTAVPSAARALLDESERRRLKSYRPPTGVDACDEPAATELLAADVGSSDAEHVTGRWTAEERDALLALARASIEPDERDESSPPCAITVPPPRKTHRVAIRRATSEITMTEVRRRLHGAR